MLFSANPAKMVITCKIIRTVKLANILVKPVHPKMFVKVAKLVVLMDHNVHAPVDK